MSNDYEFDFQQMIESIRAQYQFDFVGVAMVQSQELRFELRWEFVTGNKSERYRRIVLQSGKGIAGIVFKTGKPMLIENVDQMISAHDLYNYPIVITESLKSFGAVPLIHNNRVRGVLLVGFRENDRLTSEKFYTFKHEVEESLYPFHIREVVR